MNALVLSLHFLRPWWWLALAPLPPALWMLARGGGGRAALARLADAALLPHLVRATSARRYLALALVALAWLLAVAALSGPAWQKTATPLYVNGAARVVVLSLSNDMLAQDLKPDRMAHARFAVRDLLDDAGDARTALVAYAGAAFTVAPLTSDKRTVLNLLHALQPDVMPVPGNDAAAGIRHGLQLLRQAHVQGGELVLVTDTAGPAAIAAARAAGSDGVRVDVLGIGTTDGAPVPRSGGGFASGPGGLLLARRDDAALRDVASAGGGRYAILQADGSGPATLGAPVAKSGHASHGEQARLWRDGGVWLLPAILLLAALAFRRGWLLVLAVLVLPMAMPAAHAATWPSWWANRDQQALQALQRGDTRQAQKLAATPAMRGAADYRAGKFADAAREFAQGGNARSHYNLGNALARQGEYDKAITAYRRALQLDPSSEDARANLDAVEAWLKQHSQASPATGQGKPRPGGPDQSGAGGQPAPADKSVSRPQQGGSPSASQGQAHDRQAAPPGASAQAESRSGPGSGEDHGGASAAEAERQRQQVGQAAQGLEQELLEAGRDLSKARSDAQRAFALGQSEPRDDTRFNAEQRAMLRSVPDDPGALLRRKFRLEWEQRHGETQQEHGQ